MELKHFKLEEFACPCCGENKMDKEFLEKIDKLRELSNFPFIITSGYRCEKHNKEVGGKPNSAHTRGLAVDIKVNNGSEKFRLVSNGFLLGINRFGIGSKFIHIDVDTSLPQNVIWTY